MDCGNGPSPGLPWSVLRASPAVYFQSVKAIHVGVRGHSATTAAADHGIRGRGWLDVQQHLQMPNVTDCDSKITKINDPVIAWLPALRHNPLLPTTGFYGAHHLFLRLNAPPANHRTTHSPQTLDFGVLFSVRLGDGQFGAQ